MKRFVGDFFRGFGNLLNITPRSNTVYRNTMLQVRDDIYQSNIETMLARDFMTVGNGLHNACESYLNGKKSK